MNSNYLKKLLFSISFVLMFASIGYCEKTIPNVNDFFRDGDYKDIEVLQPKLGFIGSVSSIISGVPSGRIPSSDEDFLTQYVRITIVKKIKMKDGIQIVFQIDEIDPNGVPVTYHRSRKDEGYHEPLYYAYLGITSDGCKVAMTTKAFHDSPKDNPDERHINGTIARCGRYGIRFPLSATFPPALNLQENYRDNSWMHKEDHGIVYTGATVLKEPYYMRVDASLIQKVYPFMKAEQKDKRYYSNNDKTLSEAKTPDSTEVIVLEKETQLWGRPDDWLWLELERTDNDGNIIMRCRRWNKKQP